MLHPGRGTGPRWRAVAAVVLAALALPPDAARAQTAGADGGGLVRGVTVQTRPRPDYAPAGVRLGTFRADGWLEAGPGFDSNPLPTARRRAPDAFAEQSISLGVASGWSRHSVSASAVQNTRQYFGNGALSWNDFSLEAGGRLDIGRASSLALSYSRQRSHLDVANFDLQRSGVTRPVMFDSDVLRLNGVAALNRVNVDGALERRTFRFEREAGRPPGIGVFVSDRDQVVGELGATYLVQPGRGFNLASRLTQISFQDPAQRGRDSFTWEVLAGARYDFNGMWGVRFAVGYRRREYESQALRPLSGPALELQAVMMPSQLATITVTAQRTIEESIRANSVSYDRTALRANLDYEVRRNIVATAEVGAELREYQQPRERVVDGLAAMGGRILLNRHASVHLTYQHVRRFEAPTGFREYDRNLLSFRLRLSL